MKKISIILIVLMMVYACQDDTSNVSKVTHFAVIKLKGEKEIRLAQGAAYTEQGASAMEGNNEVEVKTAYSKGAYFNSEGLDTSTDNPDKYTVTYSATNQDGFDAQNFRSVWVAKTGDLKNSIEGLYRADVQRAPKFEKTDQYSDLSYIIIKRAGETNQYKISDALGGYYDIGRDRGSTDAALGAVITVNNLASNDVSISSSQPLYNSAINITDFTVDSANKKITFTANATFGNGTFKIQLTQIQL